MFSLKVIKIKNKNNEKKVLKVILMRRVLFLGKGKVKLTEKVVIVSSFKNNKSADLK
jgi:hypothetical protein